MAGSGSKCGEFWGCGAGFCTTLRGTTYTDWCVQQVPLGPDRLKKKVWGAKLVLQGGFVFCFLFFFFVHRGDGGDEL